MKNPLVRERLCSEKVHGGGERIQEFFETNSTVIMYDRERSGRSDLKTRSFRDPDMYCYCFRRRCRVKISAKTVVDHHGWRVQFNFRMTDFGGRETTDHISDVQLRRIQT